MAATPATITAAPSACSLVSFSRTCRMTRHYRQPRAAADVCAACLPRLAPPGRAHAYRHVIEPKTFYRRRYLFICLFFLFTMTIFHIYREPPITRRFASRRRRRLKHAYYFVFPFSRSFHHFGCHISYKKSLRDFPCSSTRELAAVFRYIVLLIATCGCAKFCWRYPGKVSVYHVIVAYRYFVVAFFHLILTRLILGLFAFFKHDSVFSVWLSVRHHRHRSSLLTLLISCLLHRFTTAVVRLGRRFSSAHHLMRAVHTLRDACRSVDTSFSLFVNASVTASLR